MSPTFGERMTAIEEKMEVLSEMLITLLQFNGFIDSEGNWIEVDVDEASSGP